MVEHDLDIGADADWIDVYRTIAMDHLAGGSWSGYVRGQGWDVEEDGSVTEGPDIGTDVHAYMAQGGPDDSANAWGIAPRRPGPRSVAEGGPDMSTVITDSKLPGLIAERYAGMA
jgi:hypothetical protein